MRPRWRRPAGLRCPRSASPQRSGGLRRRTFLPREEWAFHRALARGVESPGEESSAQQLRQGIRGAAGIRPDRHQTRPPGLPESGSRQAYRQHNEVAGTIQDPCPSPLTTRRHPRHPQPEPAPSPPCAPPNRATEPSPHRRSTPPPSRTAAASHPHQTQKTKHETRHRRCRSTLRQRLNPRPCSPAIGGCHTRCRRARGDPDSARIAPSDVWQQRSSAAPSAKSRARGTKPRRNRQAPDPASQRTDRQSRMPGNPGNPGQRGHTTDQPGCAEPQIRARSAREGIIFADDQRGVAIELLRFDDAELVLLDPEHDNDRHEGAGEAPGVSLGEVQRHRDAPVRERGPPPLDRRPTCPAHGRNHRAAQRSGRMHSIADPLRVDGVRPCAGPRKCLQERGGHRGGSRPMPRRPASHAHCLPQMPKSRRFRA